MSRTTLNSRITSNSKNLFVTIASFYFNDVFLTEQLNTHSSQITLSLLIIKYWLMKAVSEMISRLDQAKVMN